MALPELTLPDGSPPFLADGQSIEITPIYADVPMRTGHDRRRRLYTTVPRVVNVGLFVAADQLLAFHNWYEGPLQAGLQWFSALLSNQGPGTLWWKARFAEPYTEEAIENGYHRITAKLLLVGDGSVSSPYSPNLLSSTLTQLSGSVVITSPLSLASSSVISLLPATYLSSASFIAFKSAQDGAPPSAVDFEKRWIWMRYPYANGRTSDVTDVQLFDQRSWIGF